MNIQARAALVAVTLFALMANMSAAKELDENCIVNILNRTVQVGDGGGWSLPNVPSNIGGVRARASCIDDDGNTVTGQSEFFTVLTNGITQVGTIVFADDIKTPINIAFSDNSRIEFFNLGHSYQLAVSAEFADGNIIDISRGESGISYSITNPAVASVSSDGFVTALGNGTALISTSYDGMTVTRLIRVAAVGSDQDGDGLPDVYESANGLDPADPIDAFEDQDGDGLSALDEYEAGTDPQVADTDGDGIADGEELVAGEDGYITSPLIADSDGDGLSDSVEITVGSDPNDSADANFEAAMVSISATPETVVMTFNGIDSESSTQLSVTGTLIDGSEIDLTSASAGTNYASSDLSIVSFGLEDGQIFAGAPGSAIVTISSNGQSIGVDVLVKAFEATALSAVAIPGYANNVDVNGDYAFVAAGSAGLQVVDVSDRSSPEVVASLDTDGTAIDIKVVGSRAFIADGAAGLQVIDIADPLVPVFVSNIDTAGTTQDLVVDFDYAYLANGEAGIEIIDISDPESLVSVGVLDGMGTIKGIDIENNQVVVVSDNSLILIDVTDKESPIRLGSVNINSAKDVVVDGGFAHVAAYGSGFRVVDLSDTTKPVIVAGNAQIAPRDIALTRDFAFYAEQLFPNVVAFVNIFDPSDAVFQGTINLSPFGDHAGTGIALDASYAYITEESYVVRSDYGSSGNTKLFIAQYRDVNDNNGVAPTIDLVTPTEGQVVVEGRRFNISADASDDVVVAQVNFSINEELIFQDSSDPYRFSYKVPDGLTELRVVAQAVDLGGNTTSTDVITVEIQPDSDDDGLGDTEEVDTYSTDPSNPDSDDDGLLDGDEVALGTDPNDKDSDDDGLEDKQEVDNGTDPLNPDITPPEVVSIDPVDGAEDIPENSPISIILSEALSAKSVSQATLVVTQEDETVVPGKVKLISDGEELLFTPDGLMNDFTLHTVTVSSAKDTAGNPLGSRQFTFTTGNLLDTTAPAVVDITPAYNAADVPVNAKLTAILSEPVDPTTVTDDTVYVRDQSTSLNVPGVVSLSADKTAINFVPNAALLVGRQHRLTLTSGILDLFGNALSARNHYFTTDFEPDGQAPQLINSTVSDGATDVPTNARLNLVFDESINGLSISSIRLVSGENDISVTRELNDDRRTVTITPVAPMDAGTVYIIVVDGVEDLSGNLIENAVSLSFTTGDEADTSNGSYVQYSPKHNTSNLPLNTDVGIRVSERIDPTSITDNSFYLYDNVTHLHVAGDWSLSEEGTRLRFIPDAPLEPLRSYTLYWSYSYRLRDLAGNQIGSNHYTSFTTGESEISTPLSVEPSFADGAIDLPLNPILSLKSEVAFSRICFDDASASITAGSETLDLDITLEDTHRLTLRRTDLLSPSTEYTVSLTGICDVAGNSLPDYQLSFTTSSDTEADTQMVAGVTFSPEDEATEVDTNTSLVMTFGEPLDPISLDNISVNVNSFPGELAGELSLSGNELTFTPLNPFPGNSLIKVNLGYLYDLAGNYRYFGSNYNLTTAATSDVIAPQVVSVSPDDGSMDVRNNGSVVITFSESLDASTVTNESFVYWSNGSLIRPSVYRSADNRTVTLTGTLPTSSQVALIITEDVKDLSGNRLTDFTSSFTTSASSDTTRPSVVWQYPANGATASTDKILLYVNELIDPGTLESSFFVAQDGVLIDGTVTALADDQAIEFIPTESFTPGALIHTYLRSTATDLSGNALHNYQSVFTVYSEDQAIGSRHYPLAYSPASGASDVPLNPVIQVSYSEELDATTITEANVYLRDSDNAVVASTASLSADGRLLTVVPDSLLNANEQYILYMESEILDTDGDSQYYDYSLYFTTGETAVEDTQAPVVLSFSPSDGSQNVPLNAVYHAQFNEALNPLSFPQGKGLFVQFSTSNHELRYTPSDVLLPAASEVTETLPAVTDVSGNVPSASTTFTTTDKLDFVRPDVELVSPLGGSTIIPVNSIFAVKMTKSIDPYSLTDKTTENVYLWDNSGNQRVAVSVNLTADGRTIHIIPDSNLLVGRSYSLRVYGLYDLAGNDAYSRSYNFSTLFEEDLDAPEVELSSFDNGAVNIPTNAQIRIRFTEPVNVLDLLDNARVQISNASAETIPLNISIDSTHEEVTLVPVQLLDKNASYTISISNVADRAGHVLVDDVVINFETGSGIDGVTGSYVQYSPKHNTSNLPLNTDVGIRVSERIDPTSITDNSFYLYDNVTHLHVAGDWSLSEEGTRLRFIPDAPLEPLRSYTLYWSYSYRLRDLAGNQIGSNHYTSFTTGESEISTPLSVEPSFADGAIDLPLNPILSLKSEVAFSRICFDDASASITAGSETLDLDITLEDTHRLTLRRTDLLSPSTEYTVSLTGICDVAGNSLPDYQLSFTTSSDTEADTQMVAGVTFSPEDEATEVDTNTSLVMTFGEPLDPISLENISVSVNSFTGELAGELSLSGNELTFTPLNPFPGNSLIKVNLGYLYDLAGNYRYFGSNYNLTTAATSDVIAPQVVSVSPDDGSMDVRNNGSVVITFSESLDASTVTNESFVYWSNGSLIRPSVYRSADNRTVTLTGTLPTSSQVALIITEDVKDLSGNRLTDFTSSFTTSASSDTTRPSVVWQYPANGATASTDKILLYVNELIDPGTLESSFFVAQDGVLIDGTVTALADDQAIEFIPTESFTPGALIHTYLRSTATDLSGNALHNYQSVFTVYSEDQAIGSRHYPLAYSPASGASDVPLNPVIQVSYSEELDATTITEANVYLRDSDNAVVASTASLSADGRLLTVVPDSLLNANEQYILYMESEILDTDGDSQYYDYSLYFTTGETAVEDTQAPVVLSFSPSDGSQNVPLNAVYHAQFNEALNPLSFPQGEGLFVQFSANNHELRYTPTDVLLPAASEVTETLPAVTDVSGNVPSASTTFTTGNGIDLGRPDVISISPYNNEMNVPVNTVIVVELDEAIDPVSINNSSVYLYDVSTGDKVPVTVNRNADSSILTLVPDSALDNNKQYRTTIYGLLDLAGNSLPNHYYYFTSSDSSDETAPQVLLVGISDGQTNLPTNVNLNIRFSEAIDAIALMEGAQITVIDAASDVIDFITLFNDDQSLVTLVPARLLEPGTEYTLSVSGVQDRAGNVLEAGQSYTFTTGMESVTRLGTVIFRSPVSQDTEIPLNAVVEMKLSERVDPATVTAETFRVYDYTNGVDVPGSLGLSEGNTRITFTPDDALAANSRHYISMSNYYNPGAKYVKDLAGNIIAYNASSYGDSYFTTGTSIDEVAPILEVVGLSDGLTDVPLNAQLSLYFDERIKPSSTIGGIKLFDSNDNPVAVTSSVSSTNRTVTVVPDSLLSQNATYRYEITTIGDLADNLIAADVSGSFTTGTTSDEIDGTVMLRSPISQDTEVPLNAVIEVKLSERADPATVTVETFRVYDYTNGEDVPGSLSLSEGNTRITFTPDDALAASSRHYISMSSYYNPGAKYVKDLAGNIVGYHTGSYGDTYFTTGSSTDEIAPVLEVVGLSDGLTDVPLNAQLTLHFDEAIKASSAIGGVRLFDSSDNLITATYSVSSSNRTVTLIPDELLSGSATYRYEITTFADLANNPIAADISGSFTTGTVSDETDGTVLSRSPISQATDIPLNTLVDMFLSEPVDPATVTEETFRVYDYANSQYVTGSLSLSEGNTRVTFTPDDVLAANSRYYISMSSYYNPGAKYVKDLAGNIVGYHTGSYGDTYFTTVAE